MMRQARYWRRALLVAAVLQAAASPASASVTEAPMPDASATLAAATAPAATVLPASGSQVFVVEQGLADFLKIAGRRHGVRINVPSGLRGTIRNQELPEALDEMLGQLASYFDFDWYRDGNRVEITTRKQNTSRVIALGKVRPSQLDGLLAKAGLTRANMELNQLPGANSILVNGSPGLIAKLELLIEAQNTSASRTTIIRYGR